jgi:hypothetical protein
MTTGRPPDRSTPQLTDRYPTEVIPVTPPFKAQSLILPVAAAALAFMATALVPINTIIFSRSTAGGTALKVFVLMGVVQFLLGVVAGALGLAYFFRLESGWRWGVLVLSLLAILVGLGGPIGVFMGVSFFTLLAGHAF